MIVKSGIVALIMVVSAAFSAPVMGALPDMVQINNAQGWQIYPGGGYRYGPSIIMNSDISLDMWTSSPGANGAWDYIRYRHSSDGGHTWTADVIALKPTPGSRDAYSVCDPGVIKFGGYYYIGYTSTENAQGLDNHLYLARSTSPSGSFVKWNGSGWGGNPQPIVTYSGSAQYYGIGEPCFVMKDGKLYIYYTYADGSFKTALAICDNPNVENWPANLRIIGPVVDHGADDSLDIKYVDSLKRFIGVDTHNRFGPNATISVWQSEDGIAWERALFRGARVQCGAHNVGISGNELGHLDTSRKNFISYSYQPPSNGWGNWPTFMDPIYLTTVSPGH